MKRSFILVSLVIATALITAAPVLQAAEPERPATIRTPAAAEKPREQYLTVYPKRPTTRPAAKAAAKPVAGRQKTADFIRFVEDDNGGGRLESAIVTYKNAAGVTVHLVAALHVGEKSYYEGLSDTFKGYDALLYELIKGRDAGVPQPGVQSGGAVSGLQRLLKDVLELEFQLDHIDYTAPNFVHADLDAETFFELQEKRGESLVTLMFRSMISEMQRQAAGKKGAQPISMFDLLAAMNSPDAARQYKLLLARQFQDIEAQISGMEGEEGTVILTKRNKAAVKVLKESMAKGKKNIGVFYGAGHMRGIEDALLETMKFRRTGIEWRVAWDMTGAGPATRPARTGVRSTTGPAARPLARPRSTAPVGEGGG